MNGHYNIPITYKLLTENYLIYGVLFAVPRSINSDGRGSPCSLVGCVPTLGTVNSTQKNTQERRLLQSCRFTPNSWYGQLHLEEQIEEMAYAVLKVDAPLLVQSTPPRRTHRRGCSCSLIGCLSTLGMVNSTQKNIKKRRLQQSCTLPPHSWYGKLQLEEHIEEDAPTVLKVASPLLVQSTSPTSPALCTKSGKKSMHFDDFLPF